MQILEENMKENNILPAHYPPSLNIHTVNDAKLHIQAQRGATSSNILHFAVPGWAEVACFQFSLGLIVKSRVLGGVVAGLEVYNTCCALTKPHTHFTNLTLCVPKLE